MDFEKLKAYQEEQKRLADEQSAAEAQKDNADGISQTVAASNGMVASLLSKSNAKAVSATQEVGKAVETAGQEIIDAMTASQDSVATALNNLVIATVVSKDPQLLQASKDVAGLLTSVAQAATDFKSSKLNLIPASNEKLAAAIEKLASSEDNEVETDYTGLLIEIRDALKNDKEPVINIPAPVVNVDTSDLLKAVKALDKTVKDSTIELPENDDSMVIAAVDGVKSAITGLRFPVPNFVQDPFIRYKAVDEFDDGVSTNVKYYGLVDPGGLWYIMKVDPSSNPKTYRYAFGSANYATNWTNRASLTYDYPFVS